MARNGYYLVSDNASDLNQSFLVSLRGALDERALLSSIEALIDLQGACSVTSSSPEADGQFFVPSPKVDLPVLDLAGLDPHERKRRYDAMVEGETSKPFDLDQGPSIRMKLVRLEAQHHVLAFTSYYFTRGDWSRGALLERFAQLYTRNVENQSAELQPVVCFSEYLREAEDSLKTQAELAGARPSEPGGMPHEKESATATVQPENGRTHVPPRDEIESELVVIWQELLEQQNIGIRDDFFELGGDSILATHLMAAIEKKYHRRFELSRLFSDSTIEALARELRATKETNAIHIVPMQPEGSRTPLFCIHCASGHVLRYRTLVSLLDPDIPIYGLRAPDVLELKKLPTVEDLAELYVADIRKIQPHGAYQLCGFSFGGIVAVEIARRLRVLGEEVSVLALLDTLNPAYYRNLPFLRLLRFQSIFLCSRLFKYARRFFLGEWGDFYTGLRSVISGRLNQLVWKLRRKKSQLPERAAPKDIHEILAMYEAIGWAFAPKSYAGRITLLRAEGSDPEFRNDMTLGWEGIAQEGVEVLRVPGSHLSIMEKPQVSAVADLLRVCLAKNTL